MEGIKKDGQGAEVETRKRESEVLPQVSKSRRSAHLPTLKSDDELNLICNGGVTTDTSDARGHRKETRTRSVSRERILPERKHNIEPPPRHSRKPNPKLRMFTVDIETTSESEVQRQANSRFAKDVVHKKKLRSRRCSTSDESDVSSENERGYPLRKDKKPRDPAQGRLPPSGHQMPLSLSNKLLERSKKTLMNKVINEFEEEIKQDVIEKTVSSSKTSSNRHPPKRRQKRGKRKRDPPIDASVIITNKPIAPSPSITRSTATAVKKSEPNGTKKDIPVTSIDESEQSYTKLNGAVIGNGPQSVDAAHNHKSTESKVNDVGKDETKSSPVKNDTTKPALQELGNDLHLLLEEHRQIRNRLQSCLETTTVVKPSESPEKPKGETPHDNSTRNQEEGANKHPQSPKPPKDNGKNCPLPVVKPNHAVKKGRDNAGPLTKTKEDPSVSHHTEGRPRHVKRKADMSENPGKNYLPDQKTDLIHRFYVDTTVGNVLNSPHREIRSYANGKRAIHDVFPSRKVSSSSKEDRFSSPSRTMVTKQYRQRTSLEISPTNVPGSQSERESTGEFRPKGENNNMPLSSKHLGRLNSTAYELATALDSPPGSDQNSKPSTNTSFFHAEGQSIKSYIERTVAESNAFKSFSWCPTWIYIVFYFVLWTFIVKLMDGIEGNGPTKCTTSEEIRQWSCILGITLLYGATEIYFEGKTIGQGLFCMFLMAMLILISHSQPLSCRLLDSNLTLISYIQAGHNFLLATLIAMYRIYNIRRLKRRRKRILESCDTEGTVDSIIKTEDEDSSLFTFKDIT